MQPAFTSIGHERTPAPEAQRKLAPRFSAGNACKQ
jgi:hypothetical protein